MQNDQTNEKNQASNLLVCIIDKAAYQQFLSFAVEHELGFRKALFMNEVYNIMRETNADNEHDDDFQSSNDWQDSGCVDDPEEWVSSTACW